MSDTYTKNDNGSYSVVSEDGLRFINFLSSNPSTGLTWTGVLEVKKLIASTPNLWTNYSDLPTQAEQDAVVATSNRDTRNQLLSDSDWTQFNDSPLSDADKALWVTYRTSLRILPDHADWPNLADDDWPTQP